MYYCKKCGKNHKKNSKIGKKHIKYSKEKSKKSKSEKTATKKLYRSRKDKVIAGICGGLGEYTEIDSTVIRIIWILLILLSFGTGLLFYLLAWIIIPKEPEN